MKLALPASLGALIAEHRPPIPEPLRALAQQPVLNRCSDHGGGALWPQCAAAIPTIAEGVHLLADHIGGFADAAGKEFSGFQNRCSNLRNTRSCEVVTGRGFHPLPEADLLGQQIDHAPQTLQLRHHHS